MKDTFTQTKLYTKEIKALLTLSVGLVLIVNKGPNGQKKGRPVRVSRVTVQEDITQIQISGREVPKFELRIHEFNQVQLK